MKLVNDISQIEEITAGRPRKYTAESFLKKANQYFKECIDSKQWKKQDFIKSGPNAGQIVETDLPTLFTFEGLAIYCGVNKQFITDCEEYLKPKESEEDRKFSLVLKYVRNIITRQRLEGGANRSFDTLLISRLEGLTDKQEIKATNTNISVNVQDQELKNKLDKE